MATASIRVTEVRQRNGKVQAQLFITPGLPSKENPTPTRCFRPGTTTLLCRPRPTGIFLRRRFLGTVIIRRNGKSCFSTALPGAFLLDPHDPSP